MQANLIKIKPLIYLLLLSVIAWWFGALVWQVLYTPQAKLSMPDVHLNVQSSAQTSQYAPVYLFGKSAQTSTQPLTSQNSNVSQTKLNLKLLGVLVSPQMSVAIISKNGVSDSYVLEDEIQSGVSLEEVYQDYVVISNRGLLEKLPMAETENVFAANSDAQTVTATQMEKLQQVKEAALQNPVSVLRYVRFQPVSSGGKVISVKVWPQQEKEIFNALGFKAGDELLQVDDVNIETLSKSPDLWQAFLNKSYVEMKIKRNGQVMPLSVQLQ